MLDTCEQHSIEHGYVFSPSKCEIVAPEGTQTSYLRMYEEQVVEESVITSSHCEWPGHIQNDESSRYDG